MRDIRPLLHYVATSLPAHADELRDLDAKIGDGDLGETITRGMRAVEAQLPDLEGLKPGDQLTRAGLAFNRAAASTFGALFATALMRAGNSIAEKEEIRPEDIGPMAQAALEGIRQRGGAKEGDKTLLDALAPALAAYNEGLATGLAAREAANAALKACSQGVRATIGMRSRVSRASWVGERTIGVADPGATAVLRMFEATMAYEDEA